MGVKTSSEVHLAKGRDTLERSQIRYETLKPKDVLMLPFSPRFIGTAKMGFAH